MSVLIAVTLVVWHVTVGYVRVLVGCWGRFSVEAADGSVTVVVSLNGLTVLVWSNLMAYAGVESSVERGVVRVRTVTQRDVSVRRIVLFGGGGGSSGLLWLC